MNSKTLQAALLIAIAIATSAVYADSTTLHAPKQPGQAVRSASSLNLNSNELGFNGPFSIGTQISSAFGPIVTMKYAQLLSPFNAFMLEGDVGPQEYRVAGTWGRKLTENQRAKLTAERLAQKIDFNFTPGSTEQWVGQNAVGGDYQYLLNNKWLNSVDLSGYYAKAHSKQLSNVVVPGGTWMRHIAGATSTGGKIGVSASPWPKGVISAALNYDNVIYHRKYAAIPGTAKSQGGLGQSVTLSQLLTDRTKFEFSQSYRKVFKQYAADFSWLVPSKPGQRLELGVNASRTTTDAATGTDNRVGLKASLAWGGKQKGKRPVYSPANDRLTGDLLAWTQQPAVHMPEVLAVADEKFTPLVPQPVQQPQSIAANVQESYDVVAGQVFQVPTGYVIANDNVAALSKQNLHPTNNSVTIPTTDVVGKTYTLDLSPDVAKGPLLAATSGVKLALPKPKSISLRVISAVASTNAWVPSINTPVYNTLKVVNVVENQPVNITLPNTKPYQGNTTNLFNNPIDLSNMTYSISSGSLPPGLTANPATDNVSTITGTPTQKGTSEFTITATNSRGDSKPATFTINVADAQPVYNGTTIPSQTGQEGKPTTQIATASMFTGASLQYSMTVQNSQGGNANINLSINPTNGIITGTPPAPTVNNPTAGSMGTYNLTVSVKNQLGTATATPFKLTVDPAAPILSGTGINAPAASLGVPYSTPTKQAFIGNALKYTIDASTPLAPYGLSIDTDSGVISGTPTQEASNQSIKVIAFNYDGSTKQSVETSFPLTIKASAPITKGTIPDQTLTIGGPVFNYNAAANFEGASISYGISASPILAELTINSNNGLISFNPTAGIGTYQITVTATNSLGIAEQKFTLTVNPLVVTLACPANPASPTSQGSDGKTYTFQTGNPAPPNNTFLYSELVGTTLKCAYGPTILNKGFLTINTPPLEGTLALPGGNTTCPNARETCPVTMTISTISN